MAKIVMVFTDVPGSPDHFDMVWTCEPPMKNGKFPDTAAGKIAGIIWVASQEYAKKLQEIEKKKIEKRT
jgi:hypothetical protein